MPTILFHSTLALCPGAASVQTIWACPAFDSFLTLVTMFSILLILTVLGNVYHCSFENGLCRLGQLDKCVLFAFLNGSQARTMAAFSRNASI